MVVQHDRASGVQRLERDAVVARERVRDRRAEDALDVALADLGLDVEAADDDAQPFLAVALTKRCRQPRRRADRGQLLVGDDDDPRSRVRARRS